MRAKPTFKDGVRTWRKTTAWDGELDLPENFADELPALLRELRVEVANLPAAIAAAEEICRQWRSWNATQKPSLQDIKHTLRALRGHDDDEVFRAWRCVDGWTEAHLGLIPPHPTADDIRDAAKSALQKMKDAPAVGGQPALRGNDLGLGVDLACWWLTYTRSAPTVTADDGKDTKDSRFLGFGAWMFRQAGRHLSGQSMKAALQAANRHLKTFETRTE